MLSWITRRTTRARTGKMGGDTKGQEWQEDHGIRSTAKKALHYCAQTQQIKLRKVRKLRQISVISMTRKENIGKWCRNTRHLAEIPVVRLNKSAGRLTHRHTYTTN
jgi:hypothetical protein